MTEPQQLGFNLDNTQDIDFFSDSHRNQEQSQDQGQNQNRLNNQDNNSNLNQHQMDDLEARVRSAADNYEDGLDYLDQLRIERDRSIWESIKAGVSIRKAASWGGISGSGSSMDSLRQRFEPNAVVFPEGEPDGNSEDYLFDFNIRVILPNGMRIVGDTDTDIAAKAALEAGTALGRNKFSGGGQTVERRNNVLRESIAEWFDINWQEIAVQHTFTTDNGETRWGWA